MAAKPVPEGFNTISVYLVVPDVQKAIDHYAKAFGAEGGGCMTAPDGSVMHGEMRIGNSTFMLTAANEKWGSKTPQQLGGTPVGVHLYVPNCDAAFARAVAAGCVVKFPMMDAFWGDRYGKVQDAFGHEWGIATHKEDLTPEEIGKRAAEWMKNNPC